MGVVWGLIAALGWGVADFCTTQVARRIGVTRTILFFESIALCATIVLIIFWPGAPTLTLTAWLQMALLSLLNVAGTAFLYRAFTVGTLSVVSPIAAGYAVVTALLALLTGERPAALPLLGAFLLVGGVIIIAAAQPTSATSSSLAGLPQALASVALFGIFFWAVHFVTPALGVLWPVLVLRIVKTLTALTILGGRRVPLGTVPRSTLALCALAAFCGTAAFVSYNLGVSTSYTSIVTATSSMSTVVTVLLARSLLHEHLARKQWAGVVVIIVGVVLVST